VPAYEEFMGMHEGALDWGAAPLHPVTGTHRWAGIYHQNAGRLPPLGLLPVSLRSRHRYGQ
jgi:hypothetical protein